MAKRLRMSLLGILTVLMCFALAFGLTFGVNAKATAAEEPTVQADADVVVLDKLEDFRTVKDDGAETYSIKGSAADGSFTLEESSGVLTATETGISEIGMRKVLGLPTDPADGNYNCGLTKEAEETDDAFAERVSKEVFDRFLSAGEQNKKFSIVFPANISYIAENAFVVGQHSYFFSYIGFCSLQTTVEWFRAVYSDEGMELEDEELEAEAKNMVENFNTPTLVEVGFAVDGSGNRALLPEQAQTLFGFVLIEKFTHPKQLSESIISDDSVNVKEIVIEDGVENIPADFTYSGSLKEITIPDCVKTIGDNAFAGCGNLKKIYILGSDIEIAGQAFDTGLSNVDDSLYPSVYVNSVSQWLSLHFEDKDSNPLYNGFTGAAGRLYAKNAQGEYERLIHINVPKSQEVTVGAYAFYNSEIESITLGNVKTIGAGAFDGCKKLKKIVISRVNSIAANAFANSGIEEIEFSEGLAAIPNSAFSRCRSLKSVTFAEDCKPTSIGDKAFEFCEMLQKIVIPASVETIGKNAFQYCTKLNEVTFVQNSQLTEIGNYAFASCSLITRLDLPKTVKTIGSSAFTQYDSTDAEGNACALTININGEVTSIGTNLTSAANRPRTYNAYFKCVDYNAYKAFTEAYQIESGSKTYAICPVTVDYVYVGGAGQSETVESQRYWYGVPEVEDAYQLPYGVAATNVTLSDKSDAWYSDTGCAAQVSRDDVQNAVEGNATALQVENGKITLYMNSVTGYIAKTDIVYDRAKTYMLDDPQSFNALLISDSAELTAQNVLTIRSYADAFGKAAAVPSSVHAAGTYVIAVDNDKTFTLNIARKDIDVSAFDFMVARVGGQGVSQALESATLHLYADKDGATYPSLTPLDDEDLAYYSTVEVSQAFTRFRGEGVAITLEMDCGEYTDLLNIIYGGEYSVSNYGAYTATAEIRASGNYAYTIAQDEEAFAARGISFAQNGDVITVTKVWYVLAMSNWLVTSADATEDDYTLYNFGGNGVFGTTPSFTVPYAVFGDVSADKFGTSEDKLSFTLTYGDVNIGAFDRTNYGQYINAAMPTGNYELTVTFGLVGGTEYFSRTFRYTVTAAPLPEAELAALNTLLKGKPFGFDYDNSMHLLTDEVRAAIAALEAAAKKAQPDRTGTVWSDASYNAYYDNFKITFNLDRMRSNKYFTENDLNGEADKPVAPGKYIVYYLVTANNFVPLVFDDLSVSAYDAARRQFVFYVTIIREIEIPAVNTATYNGTAQKADIASSEYYTVNAYDGFTDVGNHDVVLTLVNSEYYRWKGKELGTATATVKFEITKALNDWIESPDVVRWIEGKFNEDENGFIGAAKFGTISYVIIDTNDNVIYDLSKNIDKRADMKAGTYILKATVTGNDNYSGLSEAFTIRILEKVGMPWWATLLIVIGSLGVAALIIFILWKKGVFQIVTEKIVVAIRTKASVDATIASVRTAKRMEEGRQSVADAKRRERIEQMRKKAAEQRALPPEEKAKQLEEKAKLDEERAEKLRQRSEAKRQKAAKMRGEAIMPSETPSAEQPQAEAAATETPETPTEE